MIYSILITIFFAVPCEYHVDCSGWTGKAAVTLEIRYECRDGRVVTDRAICGERTAKDHVAESLASPITDRKWRVEMVGPKGAETAFVVRGSPTSPIKSVTIIGNGWSPVVTKRFALPSEANKQTGVGGRFLGYVVLDQPLNGRA